MINKKAKILRGRQALRDIVEVDEECSEVGGK